MQKSPLIAGLPINLTWIRVVRSISYPSCLTDSSWHWANYSSFYSPWGIRLATSPSPFLRYTHNFIRPSTANWCHNSPLAWRFWVIPLISWIWCIMRAFEVLSWPALTFIVLVVSLHRSTAMVRTLKAMTDFAAVTATAFFSSLTLMRPVSRALKSWSLKWPSMAPGFAIPPGHWKLALTPSSGL